MRELLFCNNLNFHFQIRNGQHKRWLTKKNEFQGFQHAEVLEPRVESAPDIADSGGIRDIRASEWGDIVIETEVMHVPVIAQGSDCEHIGEQIEDQF